MSAPVKAPASAANYTPATLDPELRSQFNAALIQGDHITKIQDHLLNALNSHQNDWPTAVQNHALGLLRSGDVTSFPALLRRVLEDIRADTLTTETKGALAIPQAVVDEAVKVTKECLNEVLEVADA